MVVYLGVLIEMVDGDVGSIIEESFDGVDGFLYYVMSSDGYGNFEIDVMFLFGIDLDIVFVDVNNWLKQVELWLLQQVVQQGIGVFKVVNMFLMFVVLMLIDGMCDFV